MINCPLKDSAGIVCRGPEARVARVTGVHGTGGGCNPFNIWFTALKTVSGLMRVIQTGSSHPLVKPKR